MGRTLRFIPPGSLVEVTCRTIQGRLLLRPSRDLNEIALGILARAARLHGVGVVAFVFLSNHCHLLLTADDAKQLASFMNYLNGNLAREAGRLHAWREKFWGRRYRAIVVSEEEATQVGRLRYLLAQGCKEGLVRSPKDWPGASSTDCLISGDPIRGLWFNRTEESKARRRSRPGKYDHATVETLGLTALPAWKQLPTLERQGRVSDLVATIESETRAQLKATGRSPMGRGRILRMHPHELPAAHDRRPAPRFHASTRSARERMKAAYREFESAFRQAAEALKCGLDPHFPAGSFPPGLPFQEHPETRPPPSQLM
jgi:REP-associated tyrosine transposase